MSPVSRVEASAATLAVTPSGSPSDPPAEPIHSFLLSDTVLAEGVKFSLVINTLHAVNSSSGAEASNPCHLAATSSCAAASVSQHRA